MFPIRDHNPSARTPYVTYMLIAINVAVFGYGLAFMTSDMAVSQFYFDYALIPARISGGQNYTSVLTSMFLHAGLMHLAGNMLFLWVFGDNLEDVMGHIPFLVFYLFGGVGADLTQFAFDTSSQVPLIGASGAIAAVMGGYLLLFPKAKVDILIFLIFFIRIVPVPAWLMLAIWFGLQLLNGISADMGAGGVAYWAHAGGFVIGFVLVIPLWLRLGGRLWWEKTHFHPPHPDVNYPSRIPVVRRR